MPTQKTDTADFATLPAGEQIYDTIMAQIEPDLLTASTVKTDAPEDGEALEAYGARMARYRKAFALYEKCFEAFVTHLRDESRKTKLAARFAAEQQTHDTEEAAAEKLLSDMATT